MPFDHRQRVTRPITPSIPIGTAAWPPAGRFRFCQRDKGMRTGTKAPRKRVIGHNSRAGACECRRLRRWPPVAFPRDETRLPAESFRQGELAFGSRSVRGTIGPGRTLLLVMMAALHALDRRLQPGQAVLDAIDQPLEKGNVRG